MIDNELRGLKKRIKCLEREQENHETEIKLHRMIMDLNEKRSELIIAMTTRKLQRLTSQLDGAPLSERDHEVEKNEVDMYIEIVDELRKLNYSLIDCLCDCLNGNINE